MQSENSHGSQWGWLTLNTQLCRARSQLDWIRRLLFSAKLLPHLPFTLWPCPPCSCGAPHSQQSSLSSHQWATPHLCCLLQQKPPALNMRSSARTSVPMDLVHSRGAVRSSGLDVQGSGPCWIILRRAHWRQNNQWWQKTKHWSKTLEIHKSRWTTRCWRQPLKACILRLHMRSRDIYTSAEGKMPARTSQV